ncbi:hypothetical protein T439DRAFT_354249 [Meredithblackwellia eburnea MCA 4105]
MDDYQEVRAYSSSTSFKLEEARSADPSRSPLPTKPSPYFYIFLGIVSLSDLICTAVLIHAYKTMGGYPEDTLVAFVMAVTCWTFLIALVYILAFLDDPYSSIFTYSGKLLVYLSSWVLWIVASSLLSSALHGSLAEGVTCGQADNFQHCNLTTAVEVLSWVNFGTLTVAWLGVLFIGFSTSWTPYSRPPTVVSTTLYPSITPAHMTRSPSIPMYESPYLRRPEAIFYPDDEAGRLGSMAYRV